MGGYAKHPFATYLVTWPDGVTKAGTTCQQRWRAFVIRGATLQHLHLADGIHGGQLYDLESALDLELSHFMTPAFASRDEAAPYLGGRGDGYLECWKAPDRQTQADASAACIRIMQMHPFGRTGKSLLDFDASAHARTDGTNEQDVDVVLPTDVNLTLVYVRATGDFAAVDGVSR